MTKWQLNPFGGRVFCLSDGHEHIWLTCSAELSMFLCICLGYYKEMLSLLFTKAFVACMLLENKLLGFCEFSFGLPRRMWIDYLDPRKTLKCKICYCLSIWIHITCLFPLFYIIFLIYRVSGKYK